MKDTTTTTMSCKCEVTMSAQAYEARMMLFLSGPSEVVISCKWQSAIGVAGTDVPGTESRWQHLHEVEPLAVRRNCQRSERTGLGVFISRREIVKQR